MAETFKVSMDKMNTTRGLPGSYVIAGGTIALDGSGATTVDCLAVHGIGTIKNATATVNLGTAPGDSTEMVTVTYTGATLSLWPWKNTSGTDPTLVASDGTQNVDYIVIGIV